MAMLIFFNLLIVKFKKKIPKIIIYSWELSCSHKQLKTELYRHKLLKGLPASVILKFSGHSSERSFLKYLKLDTEVVAKKYKAFF